MTKSNLKKAIAYAEQLVGAKYDMWKNGQDTRAAEAPFWVTGKKFPTAAYVKARSCVCVGLINLMRRHAGLSVPGDEKTNYKYAGGTWIWFNALKKKGVLKPFDIRKSYPVGTLLLRNYKNVKDQGHVAVVYEKNRKGVLFSKLLHCYFNAGVQIDHAVGKSHFWEKDGYYTHTCAPEDWFA